MSSVVINGMAKRKKKQDNDDDNGCLSRNEKKARRVVWSRDLHAKFVKAVDELGLHVAVPKAIVALMNVDGITTAHVASHLQKYRRGIKKEADRVPSSSTLIQQPTHSQNVINTHPSYNVPANQTSTLLLKKNSVHQSHTEIYSPPALNMSGVAPSTLIQSQNMINNSFNIHPSYHPSTQSQTSLNIHPSYNFPVHQSHTNINPPPALYMSGVAPSTLVQSQNINIHPPPSTFPTYHQTSTFPTRSHNIINNSFNIHPSYNFPVNQTSTLLLPNKMPLHQSHTLPNTDIYTPSGFNISGPTQSQNVMDSSSIIHPPPSTFPIYHQTSIFPTTPGRFATTFDSHDIRATNYPFVASSSTTTSISDCDWYKKYMKAEPHFLQLPNNPLPVPESHKTSQNNQLISQQTEPFFDGSASFLEDTTIDISEYNLCSENSPIDFSV